MASFIDEKIIYPCRWFCRIVTEDIPEMKEQLDNTLASLGYPHIKVTEKNKSRGGKYASFELTLMLVEDGEMDKIVDALKLVPHVKIVL